MLKAFRLSFCLLFFATPSFADVGRFIIFTKKDLVVRGDRHTGAIVWWKRDSFWRKSPAVSNSTAPVFNFDVAINAGHVVRVHLETGQVDKCKFGSPNNCTTLNE